MAHKHMIWIGSWLLLLSGLAIAPPVSADTPNQSTITGTNVFNSIPPDFFDRYGSQLDPALLEQAERLSQDLDQAYTDCVESLPVSSTPRRFALGPDPGGACTSAECERYRQLLQEARAFLAQVEAQVNEADTVIDRRPW